MAISSIRHINNIIQQYILIVLFTLFFTCFTGCRNNKEHTAENVFNTVSEKQKKEEEKSEALLKVNKYLVEQDNNLIKKFNERQNLNLKVTESGLWYKIINPNMLTDKKKDNFHNKKAEVGKYVTISYELSLLDGTICYTRDKKNPKTFKIGQGGVESGLEEGILMLSESDSAIFVIPPHLAHGLLGDENKIPARAIIMYRLKVLDISENR